MVRFDPKCHCDSNNCIIQVSTGEFSYWFNDNFGTLYRSSTRPHNNNPIILMPGGRVTVEFRSTAQGGRRRQDVQNNNETIDRFGFRIALNAIYSESIPSLYENIMNFYGKKSKISKSKAKELANWCSLLNCLSHSASVMSQTLVKGNETVHSNKNSVVTWNLLRGGIQPGALDENSHNPIVEYLKDIRNEKGTAYAVCNTIKELAPKIETVVPSLLKVKFSADSIKRWQYMINLSMICLMFHSDIIEDAFDYTMGMDEDDRDKMK
jgi:hypothetical protein